MKYEWRKRDKEIYLPKNKPILVDIPPMKYFMLKGKGNPNSEAFKEAVQTLYALSYAIRMMPKKGFTREGYFEYTVFPLEGIWDLDEIGRQLDKLDKDRLIYKLMIRQPEFVSNELFIMAKNIAEKKVSEKLLNQVTFEEIKEGLCVQCMHIGSMMTNQGRLP
ncbi:GyrI-like domain-containing protein [Peribacillus sp. JNUCC 23]